MRGRVDSEPAAGDSLPHGKRKFPSINREIFITLEEAKVLIRGGNIIISDRIAQRITDRLYL